MQTLSVRDDLKQDPKEDLKQDLKQDVTTALTVEVLTRVEEFRSIGSEWDRLLDESEQCVFFLRWQWNWLWWRHYAPPRSRLHLIACRDSRGELAGLAPFYWREHRTLGIAHAREILMLGTGNKVKTSEYLDIFARRGWEKAVAEAVAGALDGDSDWDRLWLWHVPASSSVLPHLERALGRLARVEVCDRAHYIDTNQDWAAFKQSFGRSMRRNIEYYPRRLFKQYECSFRRVETAEEIEPAMDALVRLHQARWQSRGEPGSFRLPRFETFLREVARSSLADGRLRLWALDIDRKTAAVLIAFFDNGVVHFFQQGFDPAYMKDDLGTTILSLCIRDCFESKETRRFDFMGGGAAYKDLWTKSAMECVELELQRDNARSTFYRASERIRERAPELLRRSVPAPLRAARREMLRRWRSSRIARG